MLTRDANTGLLRMQEQYALADVPEPNLLREIFPYAEVPRMLFDGHGVPMDPAEDFFITDTTFRDGQQSRPPYKVQHIVKIYDMLSRLGGPNGVIRASEFFLYTDRDKEAVEKCLELGHPFPEVTGWIRASKADFKLVTAMGLRETGILTSASDYHIFLKLKKTRAEIMAQYLDIVETALASDLCRHPLPPGGYYPRRFRRLCHPLRAALDGTGRAGGQAGEDSPVRYHGLWPALCRSHAAAQHPQNAARAAPYCGVPSAWLEWHGHNDFHKVLVNSTTAWLYGCAAANTALFGFGERTGNPPLEGAIIDYISLRGDAERGRYPRHHRDLRLLPHGDGRGYPGQLSLCRLQFQCHQRGDSCRRHAEERRDLQHLRYREDPRPPRAGERHRQIRAGRHRPLDQQLSGDETGSGGG